MATVPLGLGCAIVAMVLTGVSLNVYSQIGLVLLVGIIAKNGILIVEFANQLRDHGAGVREAIEEACRIRLRPVMMTMAATVLGGVPLLISSGAGAEARAALGWVIVGGLGLATVLTLFLTPVAYLLLAGLSKPRAEEIPAARAGALPRRRRGGGGGRVMQARLFPARQDAPPAQLRAPRPDRSACRPPPGPRPGQDSAARLFRASQVRDGGDRLLWQVRTDHRRLRRL